MNRLGKLAKLCFAGVLLILVILAAFAAGLPQMLFHRVAIENASVPAIEQPQVAVAPPPAPEIQAPPIPATEAPAPAPEQEAAPAGKGEPLLMLAYPVREARLAVPGQEQLKTLIASKKFMKAPGIQIHAYAPPSAGALTLARRVAYYRAMLLRNDLLRLGVPSLKISVLVDDKYAVSEGDRVDIVLP